MKRSMYVIMAILGFMILLPTRFVFAQKSLPQVPITYPGDTDETIRRRAQWIEGAKKEGEVVWWGSESPELIRAFYSEFNNMALLTF